MNIHYSRIKKNLI